MSDAKPTLTPSWNLVKPSVQSLIKYASVSVVLIVLPSVILDLATTKFFGPDGQTWSDPGGTWWLILLFGAILTVVGTASFIYYMCAVKKGNELHLSDTLSAGLRLSPKYFALSVIVGLLAVLGLIALIIPGLIIIRRYFLAPYYMVDGDTGVFAAMKLSAEATKPISWYIYGTFGVVIALTLVASPLVSVLGVVGSLLSGFLSALTTLIILHRYFEVKSQSKTAR